MPSEATNEATRREWRELGFYYHCNDDDREWLLLGSKEGLLGFARAVRRYSENPANAGLSEHEHFGPYSYLELGTWSEPTITDHWIAGPLPSLAWLAQELERQLSGAEVGDRLSFREAFAPESPYEFTLVLQPAGHDPARNDPCCW